MILTIAGRTYLARSYFVHAAELGAWIADVSVVAADIVEGAPCTVGGWPGTVRAVRQAGPVAHLDIRAGDDAIERPTTARQWAATLPAETVAGALAGEAGTRATAPGQLAAWRARGGSLRDEINRLARWLAGGAWHVSELDGSIVIGPREGGTLAAPGELTDAGAGWRCYALSTTLETLPVLVGRTIDGHRVERASYVWNGKGAPSVDLFAPRPVADRPVGVLVGGTVEGDADERATVRLDDGTVLGDVPLWFLPGVRIAVPDGTRVLVADLGGDPRAPIAFCAPFDSVPEGDLGPALRIGDVVMMPVGAAGTPTPTPLQFAPGVGTSYGAPGVGKSRVML